MFTGIKRTKQPPQLFLSRATVALDRCSCMPPLTAFISTLSFVADGTFTGTMTPVTAEVSDTPIPAALPLFASGLGALGLLLLRGKRTVVAAIAA